jgi:polysaccharide pyruvyl transferase WcaK-like protein
MKKSKIGIRGAYGERNFGDDALQYFLIKWVKKNDIKSTFIGTSKDYINKLFPSISYINKELIYKKHFKKIILGGGTQFFSFKRIKKSKYPISIIFHNPILFLKKTKRFIEKKYFYKANNFNELYAVGIGFGPFIENSEIHKEAIRNISLMKSVFPRDNYSYEFAKRNNKNTFKGTDICFLPNIIDYSKLIKNRFEVKKIGIIVRDWNYKSGGENYLSSVLNQYNELSNYEVDFIFFKDEPDCELLLKDKNIVKWNPETQSIYNFLEVLSNYDLFISARFHGVIFGGLLNIPSIAIEIEPKLRLTKEFLGEGVVLWKQPFEEQLLSLINNISLIEMKKELKKNVLKQSNIAVKMFNELTKQIHE